MVSTVGSRPNHYEVLGLSPTANSDEITAAFAREVTLFRPRPFGGLAEVSVAFETLRDPAKRRAYDASLGLGPEPEPAAPVDRAPLPASASMKLMERLAVDPLLPPEISVGAAPRPEPRAEPETPAFVAASRGDPAPDQPRQPEAVERIRIEPQFSGDRALRRTSAVRMPDAAGAAFNWNRQALAAGALIVSAALLGAWVGLEAGNDNQPEQSDRVVTTRLPPARALPIATAALSAPAPAMVEARPERRTRPIVASAPAVRARPPLQIDQSEEPEATQPGQGLEVASNQAVAESAPAEAAAARLPLPNAVIARTIGRIGYACGEVASTTAIEGAAGAFKVTCTSGHSYRAAPVRGRYRFRRL